MEYHKPVMLQECLDGLRINPSGVYVDTTFGGGGHSRAILDQLGSDGRLVAFDQDADALSNVVADGRLVVYNENFRHLKNFLRLGGIRRIDGLLADLGVSSHQFDTAERGFSFRTDAPLDLRMDRRQSQTAADVVNSYDEAELRRVLALYGELPQAGAMARRLCELRMENPIDTTQALCSAVERFLPRGRENKYLAMLFQALRIEVNGELEALQQMLLQAVELLNPGGRLVVISYHSLEDRLVKNLFRSGNFEGLVEKDFYGNVLSPLRPVVRKAMVPTAEEVADNNRARSAKLRIAEKVEEKE